MQLRTGMLLLRSISRLSLILEKVLFKKDTYLDTLAKSQWKSNAGAPVEVISLPAGKRGRKATLGEHIDEKVKVYVRSLQFTGTPTCNGCWKRHCTNY